MKTIATAAATPRDDRILRPPAAAAKLGYKSRVSVYALVREGRLPPPLKISARCVGWRESTLNNFLASCESRREASAA